MSGFLEILSICFVYIDERLGIPVDYREPGALYLYHDPVPLFEGMEPIRHIEFYTSYLIWNQRFGILKTIPVFTSENFPRE